VHWMDRAQSWVLKDGVCFHQGWGTLDRLDEVIGRLKHPAGVPWIDPSFRTSTHLLAADLRVGTFLSPFEDLPKETREARFWWLHPTSQPARAAVVLLAAWGDEGPTLRGRMAAAMVREGVSVLILENPFYGVRRRKGQRAGGLLTVQDFIWMQAAAFEEARALVGWAQRHLDVPVAVAGFSMGAHLAGTTASASPQPLPVVMMAPPRCPSEPFTDGPLRRNIAWSALGPDTVDAQHRWREIMDSFDLLGLPPPRSAQRVRILGCARDGLVSPHHTEQIAQAWDAPVEWLDVGHVGAALLHGRALRRAVREVLGDDVSLSATSSARPESQPTRA
jgi:dienelactone hydrolase